MQNTTIFSDAFRLECTFPDKFGGERIIAAAHRCGVDKQMYILLFIV